MKQLIRLLLLVLFFLAGTHLEVQAHTLRDRAAHTRQQDLAAWSQQALKSIGQTALSGNKPLNGFKKRPFRKCCLPENDDVEEEASSLKKNRTDNASVLAGFSDYFGVNSYPPPFSASCYPIKNLLSFCKDPSGRNTPVCYILFQVFRI